jgi:succinoglycan biosynthesis protein ExoO
VDVSVVITSFNVAGYIAQAIRSALDQHGVTVEVIVVDDASTDATWDVISAFTDERVASFRLPRNAGPSVARNVGFAEARGEWIAMLDGDDILLPGRLQRMVARARALGADMVVDNLLVYRESDAIEFPMFEPRRFATLERLTLAQLIRERWSRFEPYALGYLQPIVSTAWLRRHPVAYDPALRIGEDYRFMVSVLALGAVCGVEPSVGYRYTSRLGSISNRMSLDAVIELLDADAAFMAGLELDADGRRALRYRLAMHREIRAYLLMTDALKRYDPAQALAALWSCPTAALRLWVPLRQRLRRS